MLTLKIDTRDLKRLKRDLAAMRAKAPLAIARGLNEGGDKVRTQVRRAMREQTGLLRLRSVTDRQRTIRAFAGALSYSIVFAGKPSTKPDEFSLAVKRGKGGGVTVRMWGVPHRFQRSFQIPGRGAGGGLRMRLGGERFPIRGFDGPNLAKEATKGQVAPTFLAGARLLVEPMIIKRIARLL